MEISISFVCLSILLLYHLLEIVQLPLKVFIPTKAAAL